MSQNSKVFFTICAGGIDLFKGVNMSPIENVEKLAESIMLTLK